MAQYYKVPQKPSGCLAVAGWAMLIIAALMVAFGVFFWIYDDQEWSRKQSEEGKLIEEWEKENSLYEQRILMFDSLSTVAFHSGDKARVLAYEDSILCFVLNDTEVGTEDDIELTRLDSLLEVSLRKGKGDAVMNYCDSIREKAIEMGPPMPNRKYLGFPLGGLLSVFVFILAALPMIIGVILLVVYYSKRSSYRGYQRMNAPPPPPPASI